MGMFNSGMRKPRRFNHQYIYVNERKEKLDKMEEQAKRDLDIRGKFVEGTTHLKRRKESGRKPVHLGVILVIIALLIFLWHYLQTGSWSWGEL